MAQKSFKKSIDISRIMNEASKSAKAINYKSQNIDFEHLVPNPRNYASIGNIEDLAVSIMNVGLQQSLSVRRIPETDDYMIFAGHRRYFAIKSLIEDGMEEYSTIPCLVFPERDADLPSEFDQDIYDNYILAVTNEQIRNDTPRDIMTKVQYARDYYREMKRTNMQLQVKQNAYISSKLDISEATLRRYQRIENKVIPEIKDLFFDGKMPMMVAYNARTMSEEDQHAFYEVIKEDPTQATDRFLESFRNHLENERTLPHFDQQMNDLSKVKEQKKQTGSQHDITERINSADVTRPSANGQSVETSSQSKPVLQALTDEDFERIQKLNQRIALINSSSKHQLTEYQRNSFDRAMRDIAKGVKVLSNIFDLEEG